MPHVHDLNTRVRGRRTSAKFRVMRGDGIPRVQQEDGHSCGFLAALVVLKHLRPEVTVRDVLVSLMPSPSTGCDQKQLIRALSGFGIDSRYKERLGWKKLIRLTREGHPVIVTVQPEWYACDHWTVICGLTEQPRRVLLSNYDWQEEDGLSWYGFNGIWSPRGAGLVCQKA